MAAGIFDNLPDHGRPLSLQNNPFEDPSLWMAHHLLRVNGFAPPWIEEAGDLDRACSALVSGLAGALGRAIGDYRSRQQAIDEFRSRGAELNSRILTYNLKSPSVRFHKRPLDLDAEIAAALAAAESAD
jgi:hypothetical protein